MPQNPTKRLRYFDHQFLRAADFNDEQDYHLWRRRLHNRALHTWGIAEGLEVTFSEGASSVTVQQGTAIDSEGREIVLTEDRTLDLSDKPAGAAVYIAVEYAEAPSDLSKETDIKDNSRWTEKPNVLSFTERPADPSRQLIVGKVSRTGSLISGKVDNADRRAAGAVSGDITTSALTLRREGVDPAKWPKLTCGGASLAVLDNASLKVVGGAIIPSVGDNATAGIQFPSDPGGGTGDEAFIRYFATDGENTALRIGIGNDSTDVISFWQHGAERMVISRGNVGIGAASPTAKLQVTGGGNALPAASGAAQSAGHVARLRDSSNLILDIGGNGGNGFWLQSTDILNLATNYPLLLNPNGGNVAIGTTAPGNSKLKIASSATDFADFRFDAAGGGQLEIVAWAQGWNINSKTGGKNLHLNRDAVETSNVLVGRAGKELFVRGSDGNVGIGTPAPKARLDVADTSSDSTKSILARLAEGDSTGVGTYLGVKAYATQPVNAKSFALEHHFFGSFNSAINFYRGGGVGGGAIGFATNDGSEKVRIEADGNVAIGSATTPARLQIIHQNQDAGGSTLILGPTTQSNLRLGYNGEYSWIQSHGSKPLAINPIGNNVGIGTVDPKARLQVVGGAIMPALGDNPAAGIQFPPDPAGGAGDEAFIRYFSTARAATEVNIGGNRITIPATESTALRIGVGNDADDVISFWQQGAERMVISGGAVTVRGNLVVGGTKTGYVADQFVNNLGETLEKGDVIVVGDNQSSLFYGKDNNIPYLEVDLTETAYDTRVCGIVCEVFGRLEPVVKGGKETAAKPKGKATKRGEGAEQAGTFSPVMSPQPFRPSELAQLDHTKIGPGQVGAMVTLGAFAHCKVDADIAPIEAGDLLTTSPTRGHAQKVTDHARAAGAIIGKALGGLQKGKGSIPVLVTLH